MNIRFSDDELDKIIREIIGAERKVIFDTGNSPTRRNKVVRSIIDRRAKEMVKNDT